MLSVHLLHLLEKYDAKNITTTVTANDTNTDNVLIRLDKDI
jgi:hypothetical protein